MSAAKAAGDHMRDWWLGTPEGTSVSMGVISDGSYGAPPDVIFSYPLTIKNKQWAIVKVIILEKAYVGLGFCGYRYAKSYIK